MTQSTILFAYEINAQTAKNLLQKRSGFAARLRKFKSSELVQHVSDCWDELEELFSKSGVSVEDKILYTICLSDPLRIGKKRNDIVNNSFLMSAISDESRFGQEALEAARYYQYSENSSFEKNQFSILLDELSEQFSKQEVGIFGWVNVTAENVDRLIKEVAVNFSRTNNGELHFIEFSNDGKIYPNFSDVNSQKFEGKIAGNYSLTLMTLDYQSGINRLNHITETVTRKTAIQTNFQESIGQEDHPTMSEQTKSKKSYSDEFKMEVAEATLQTGATLASVGEQFGVSPTLVRNWKIKFIDEQNVIEGSCEAANPLELSALKDWLQKSEVSGTIDSDGDLYATIETSSEEITEVPMKLFVVGSQKLASGPKSDTFSCEAEITTNQENWIRSDFLKGVNRDDPSFSLNLALECYAVANSQTFPLKIKTGLAPGFPSQLGSLSIDELKIIHEDGDFRAEGSISGKNGFVYGFDILTEEPEDNDDPQVNKVSDDEGSTEFYEFLWDVKEGDTIFVRLREYSAINGKIAVGFTGKADVEEVHSSDDAEDDFDGSEITDIEETETEEGDSGLFEFEIKRGVVDADGIEDEDIKELYNELKSLCVSGEHEKAVNLLLPALSFEFGPDELDDDPSEYLADLDYIEFECSTENSSLKIGFDDELVVTVNVQFEIPLVEGISTTDLQEYIVDSGGWAAASVSPGWGYTESDGDNLRFLGVKA